MDTSGQPSAGGPTLLGGLLSETFAYAKAHVAELLLGAAVFGLILGGLQLAVGMRVAKGMQQHMGLDTQRMEELSGRIEAGDEAALDELEDLLQDNFAGMNDDQKMAAGFGMAKAVAPAAALSTLVSILLGFLAYAYYSLVAVEGKDVRTTLNRAAREMFPLVGVSIWSFIRSFVWIPVLALVLVPFLGAGALALMPLAIGAAVVLAIVFYPRFIAAPLIFLAERKGVVGSVNDSYLRTRGYWAKIVGNMIVAMIALGIASFVVTMLLAAVLSSVPVVLAVLSQIVSQLVMALSTVFSVRLSHTVLQHPRA